MFIACGKPNGVKESKRKELGDRGKGIGKRAIVLYEIEVNECEKIL